MLQLLYVSRISAPLDDRQLESMLAQARDKNATLDITGMLLFHRGYFMQLIEGPEQAVLGLFDTIRSDVRHHDVRLIGKLDVPERSFADWSMAYRPLSDADIRATEGFSDIFYRGDPDALLLRRPTLLVQVLVTLFRVND